MTRLLETLSRRRVLVALLCLVGLGITISAVSDADVSSPDAVITVSGPLPAPTVPAGFVGLSMEYQSLLSVIGPASHPDQVVQRLVGNLTGGRSPVIRIGGDSTDHAWWPARGVRDPDLLRFRLTPQWLAGLRAFASTLRARLIMGINFEAGSRRLAGAEAAAFDSALRPWLSNLELGNEPNLYDALTWYRTLAGEKVKGRPPGWDQQRYLADFSRVSRTLPPLPLAGPALGAVPWMTSVLGRFLSTEPRVRLVTFHRYPLDRCYTHPGMVMYPTLQHLLSPLASRGLAASVAPFVRLARERGLGFQVDELNSVACSGASGLSDRFASALWALDTLFAMAREGVAGVNIHTLPQAAYRLFTTRRGPAGWSVQVAPEYYGLLMFALAAPPGSQLLQVSLRGTDTVRAWATAGSGREPNVVLINDSPNRPHTVQVSLAGDSQPASLIRLLAPGILAKGGVTIGGMSYGGQTTTGRLVGAPVLTRVRPSRGGYRLTLPAGSAALLTVGSGSALTAALTAR